ARRSRVDLAVVIQDLFWLFVEGVKEDDLGILITLSGSLGPAQECARRAGLGRHGVEYSLGFFGETDRMADRQTLELSTMCGHGMLSFDFVRKLVEWVKQGRRSPEQAAATMARFCSCGVFNPTRACRLMKEVLFKIEPRSGDRG